MDDRSRSRTPSRTRRKGRSPTPSDHYTYSDATYSDSFNSEDESTYGRKSQPSKGKVRGNKKGSKSNGKTNTATRKKPLGHTSQVQSHSPRNTDYVTKRMLSARRMKINELRNELEGLSMQVVELRQENKLLKREKHLNEKAIDRFEDRENDVPNLIQRHSEELRALKEQLRRQKQKYLKADKKLKDTEDELDRTKRLLRKMKGLVEDKKLGEREELSKKLTKLESELEDKDHKLKGVERHVENLQKNHKHEMGIERARHRETQQQLAELREEVSRVNTQLKEREKELDVRNIYSKRMMKAPHRLNSSISSSPIPDLNYNSKPPRKPKSSDPEMTPREKMKIYNEKRRDEEKRHREKQPVIHKSKPTPKPKPSVVPVVTKSNESLHSSVRQASSSTRTSTKGAAVHRRRQESPPRETSPVLTAVHVGSKSRADAKKAAAKTKKPQSPQENYVPTFLTELQKEDKSGKDGRIASPDVLMTRSGMMPSEQREGSSPTLMVLSDAPSSGKAKAGRRSRKPEGTTHLSVEQSQRDSDSPVIFDLTASKQSKIKHNGRSRVRPIPNKPGSNSLVMMEEDTSLPWEEADKRREMGQQEELRRQRELEDAKREEEKERMAEKAEQEAGRRKAEEEQAEAREQEQWNAERERKKQESQSRKEREEQTRREKLERERQEEEDRKRLQREEEERRERERQFQREQEERERQLRENEKFRKEQEEKDSEQRKQKELLLARMREIDSQKKSGPPEVSSPTSKKNEYNFKQSIENMHHGKPAYDDVAVPVLEKQKKKNFLFDDDDDDNDSGGYKPTFSAGTKNTRAKKGSFKIENDTVIDFSGSAKQNKKKNLMEDLFGNSSSTTGKSRHTNGDSDLVFGSSKGQSGKNRRGMRESSSTALFGGGNAIVDDDDTPPNNNGSQLLPRRTKQPSTTFHTRPAVNAVDDLDDDIEEVVL